MSSPIETIRKMRTQLLEKITALNTVQLNQTPPGFSNNIAWNLGHMVAVQQGICYKATSLPTMINSSFWKCYGPGTKPTRIIHPEEIASIKELLLLSLDKLEADYDNRIFNNYNTWTTRLGNELTGIEDALSFLTFHEALHAETIMRIVKLIND
jgi:hypothetical protein